MSTTQLRTNGTSDASRSTARALRLEVAIIPVSDVERAKAFYAGLGWRVDADAGGGVSRLVQITPPGSDTSIIFGSGVTSAAPGTAGGFILAVEEIDAARD